MKLNENYSNKVLKIHEKLNQIKSTQNKIINIGKHRKHIYTGVIQFKVLTTRYLPILSS